MKVEMELWQLITLLLAFFGCVAGFGKVLLAQFERRLVEQFASQSAQRELAQRHLDERLSRIESEQREADRELADLKAALPTGYVRREDYIRGEAGVIARIDGLASRLELVFERLPRRGE